MTDRHADAEKMLAKLAEARLAACQMRLILTGLFHRTSGGEKESIAAAEIHALDLESMLLDLNFCVFKDAMAGSAEFVANEDQDNLLH